MRFNRSQHDTHSLALKDNSLCENIILPYQITAEEEAEDEHKDGSPKHHDIDIERKVLEPYIWHPETVVWEVRAHG